MLLGIIIGWFWIKDFNNDGYLDYLYSGKWPNNIEITGETTEVLVGKDVRVKC